MGWWDITFFCNFNVSWFFPDRGGSAKGGGASFFFFIFRLTSSFYYYYLNYWVGTSLKYSFIKFQDSYFHKDFRTLALHDSNGIRAHNHSVRKRTNNYFAKLASLVFFDSFNNLLKVSFVLRKFFCGNLDDAISVDVAVYRFRFLEKNCFQNFEKTQEKTLGDTPIRFEETFRKMKLNTTIFPENMQNINWGWSTRWL